MCTHRPSLPPKGGISRNTVGVTEVAPIQDAQTASPLTPENSPIKWSSCFNLSYLYKHNISQLNQPIFLYHFTVTFLIFKVIFKNVPFALW